VVVIAFVKLLLALAVSLSLSDWWTYGPLSTAARNSQVVESCSNSNVGDCYSFCRAAATVDVILEDDDIAFDDLLVPPNMRIVEHSTTTGFCIAELSGTCAYNYWLIFKLVPVLLCVLLFALQCFCWRHYKEFTPQQRQYDVILRELYPDVMVDDPEPAEDSSMGRAAVGSGRLGLLCRLHEPYFYSVFAFIEMVTVAYVWGELLFPSVYCGSVRPLSLYYFPILMSLLDLTKFNVYTAGKLFWNRHDAEALFAAFSLELFATNLWVTAALAAMFAGSLFGQVVRRVGSLLSDAAEPRPFRETLASNTSNPLRMATDTEGIDDAAAHAKPGLSFSKERVSSHDLL